MSEIILTNQLLSRQSFKEQCGIELSQLKDIHGRTPEFAIGNTPYLLESLSPGNNQPDIEGLSALNQLAPMYISRDLTNLSLSFGSDNVLALTQIRNKLHEANVGLTGASTSFYGNRVSGFIKAVQEYQSSLMQFREAIEARSPHKLAAEQKLNHAYKELQSKFQYEMEAVTAQMKSRRGSALSNIERGKNIARSSRNVTKLDVTSQAQTSQLAQFAKYAKFLGNGLAVIDFTSRIGNIHNTQKAGGNWHRQLFIESSGFAASAAIGTGFLKAGTYGLSLLMVSTPLGWAGFVIGGALVVGATAGASMTANNIITKDAGGIYDSLMRWITSS
ncbi:hypothetical protein SG34_027825 [Thalassomonas viridans]|uniref:Channel forming colicins domain-containing protein n=1 Tax=Thalassomonas viridans TaxID=137584 RepID=A0AAE9Z1T1_9GAMM|nr:hypothetical protein [Thalassomonas viridans]WDE05065.1 hypothetical protein SG34_027825 [Thalassomonas viridans]